MAPTCSRATLRLFATILLTSSIANAAALPHELLDPRTPLTQEHEEIANALAEDARSPQNFWESLGKLLQDNSGWDIFRDFWAKLLGVENDSDNGGATSTTIETLFVTATVTNVSNPATSLSLTTTPTPESSSPIYLSTALASETASVTILPSGQNDTDLPSAVPITGEFSVTIPVELLTSATPEATKGNLTSALVTAPLVTASIGTGLPLPLSSNGSTIEPSLATASLEPLPSSNETFLIPSEPVALTSVVIVTATVFPSPVEVGTAPLGTATESPLSYSESALWSNSSFVAPTALPGTAAPLGTAASAGPLYPNVTAIVNGTVAGPTLLPGTGTGAALGTASTIIPPYVNATAASVLPGSGYATPSIGTGYASPSGSEIPVYTNATALPGTASLPSAGTALPPVVSGAPLYTNISAIALPTALAGTGTGAVSAATSLPAPSESPIFSNTTITNSSATSASSVASPSATEAVQFPGALNITVILPTGKGYGYYTR